MTPIVNRIIYDIKYDNFDRQNFSIIVVGCDDNLQKHPHEITKEIMIVDSIWLYPILGIVGLAILYWFN